MKVPRLTLQAPPDATIFRRPEGDSRELSIRGRVICSNFDVKDRQSLRVQIELVRFGSFDIARSASKDTSTWYRRRSQRARSQGRDDELQCAEKLSESSVRLEPEGCGDFASTFELVIPSISCPTIALPSVEVSYAVVAQVSLPSGQTLHTHQGLRISKPWLEKPSLLPSPKIIFPESPLAVKVTFRKQNFIKRQLPLTLHLEGLDPSHCGVSSIPSVSWVRESEIRKMTPRTIQWELEEKAIVISGRQRNGDMVAMAEAKRCEEVRIVSKGKYQPVLHYPFKTLAGVEAESEVDIQFNADIPMGTELPYAGELAISGDRLIQTMSCSNSVQISPPQPQERTRFAVHMEHSLRVCIHMGEDTFHKATGSLVHRKPAQFAYTVVVPLKAAQEAHGCRDCDSDADLPAYQVAFGSPPIYSVTEAV